MTSIVQNLHFPIGRSGCIGAAIARQRLQTRYRLKAPRSVVSLCTCLGDLRGGCIANQSPQLISTARRRRRAIVKLLSGCECAIRYGGEAIRLKRSVENNQARLEIWLRTQSAFYGLRNWSPRWGGEVALACICMRCTLLSSATML